MTRRLGRRGFLGAAAAGAILGANTAGGRQGADETPPRREVRLEYLLPKELKEAQATCPTIFQPLGTIEWHGVHSPVGVDALKAHALCVRAAQQGGGLVAPPLYGGVGGVSQRHTFIMDPEGTSSQLLRPWLEQLCREMTRDGFRAIIMLTGHYGPAQQIVVRETAVRMSRALGVPVLGTPEYLLAIDADYTGDHAAWGETSLMMHLYPGSVDVARLGDPPHEGVGGRDPKAHASAKDGRLLTKMIVSRLAKLTKNMPTWNDAKLDRFIEAEAGLVAKQLSAPRGGKNLWIAWRNIGTVMRDYGENLANERFEKIEEAVAKL